MYLYIGINLVKTTADIRVRIGGEIVHIQVEQAIIGPVIPATTVA